MGNGEKVKVVKEYEESDIDLKNNKLHGVLSVGILISSLIMVPQNSDPTGNPEEHDKNIRAGVVTFLNMLNKSGYTISPVEIPEAFNF